MSAIRYLAAFGLPALFLTAARSQVCAPQDLYGPYGVQSSGISIISGSPTPVAVVSRLVFGDQGKITGYSSVNFNGLFLGNPVTGTYELKTDCSFVYKLQDTSGAFQNFAGTVHSGGGDAQVRQTDPGAGAKGALKKLSTNCQNTALQGRFLMTAVGMPTPFASPNSPPAGTYSATVDADGAGKLKLVRGSGENAGTYNVDGECFVMVEYTGSARIKLRGIIVNDGREILAIETNPTQVAAVKFTAQTVADVAR